jgi:hypothetical protein
VRAAIVGGAAYGVLVPAIVLLAAVLDVDAVPEPAAANLEIVTSLAALDSAIGQDRALG